MQFPAGSSIPICTLIRGTWMSEQLLPGFNNALDELIGLDAVDTSQTKFPDRHGDCCR
jgi:hypothetical protein